MAWFLSFFFVLTGTIASFIVWLLCALSLVDNFEELGEGARFISVRACVGKEYRQLLFSGTVGTQ